MPTAKCAECNGAGKFATGSAQVPWRYCVSCKGTGEVTPKLEELSKRIYRAIEAETAKLATPYRTYTPPEQYVAERMLEVIAAILRPFITPASTPEIQTCPRCEGHCNVYDYEAMAGPAQDFSHSFDQDAYVIPCPACQGSGRTSTLCTCPNPADEDGAYCPLCGKCKVATSVPPPATPTESVREQGDPEMDLLAKYNRAYVILEEALGLNPAAYELVEMAQVAANRLTGKYDWLKSPSVPLLDVPKFPQKWSEDAFVLLAGLRHSVIWELAPAIIAEITRLVEEAMAKETP